MTFDDVLKKNGNIGPGFDVLRLGLSVAILLSHSVQVVHGKTDELWDGPFARLSMCLVPAFFALSGFLVMGSAIRTASIGKFIWFRILRIFPALSTEVTLTAIVIGPLATSLGLSEYFRTAGFWAYFENIIGNTHYYIPGVFETLPFHVVNGSIWTIQPEIFCYLWLSYLMLTGGYKKPLIYVSLAVCWTIVTASIDVMTDARTEITTGPEEQFRLFTLFVVGGAFYHFRNVIRYDLRLMIGSAIAVAMLIAIPGWRSLAVVPLTYVVMFLGLTPLQLPKFLRNGDYSYGVYLYAYPIQQLVCLWFPDHRVWWWNAMLSLPLAFAAAWLSWHFVEKPMLRFKKLGDALDDIKLLNSAGGIVGAALLVCSYAFILVNWSSLFFRLDISARANFGAFAAIILVLAVAAGLLGNSRSRPPLVQTVR